METMPLWVLIVGIVMLVVGLGLAGKRIVFLFRLISSGQPAPDRIEGVTSRLGLALRTQAVEVFGQKKLLKWSVPGAAHFFTFWAFVILGTVYLEAFGILFSRNEGWAIPLVGRWDVLGFAQDFIACAALVSLVVFWQIRVRNSPAKLGRKSRFQGSHTTGAYFVLFMIFNVIWTMFLFRGAAVANDEFPYGWGAFMSHLWGQFLPASQTLVAIGLLLHIGVMLVFLVDVVNSKHLHIFVAPLNVLFGRRPVALGAAKPLMSAGKPVNLDDIEELDEEASLGVGSIEDFSWKGLLDMATCTECGRCQDQCPAWNTEKPLSPKLLIMGLRDHAMARGEYTLADESGRARMLEGNDTLTKEVERPLVGDTGDDWFYMPEDGSAVIDPDVLWSCVTCGACVDQCPVDIEHVDHIIDMRRYQVLVENNFPPELAQLFRGMEQKGNPWNMSASARMDWAKGLDVDVKVVGEDVASLDEVEWLFWVGCAGAYEDRAKKTTRAVAELLDMAGVDFAVLGNGETCTGDSARRAGNEFVFQGLAQQNAETFQEYRVKKVVSTCAHCFNTLQNEYREFGVELEVVHHTQLLNRLVREGRLTPVPDGAGAHKRSITYHDPCYIGRHNGVYSPPRELLEILPGAEFTEMPRNSERSFCCGAGGARMWMEENIGERINMNRTNEAVGTGADQIAVGCPFCRVMLSDGLTTAQGAGDAREEVEVLDVAQMLLASVKGVQATKAAPGQTANGSAPAAPAAATASGGEAPVEETKAEPDGGDDTQTEDTVTATEDVGPAAKASGGSSLFDAPAEEPATAAEHKSVPAEAEAAKPASAGGSLFDVGSDAAEPAPAETETETAAPAPAAGGSLFDIQADDGATESAGVSTPAASEEPAPPAASQPTADLGSGGSLFDLAAPVDTTAGRPPAAAAPEAPAPSEATSVPAPSGGSGRSMFDIAAPPGARLSTAEAVPVSAAEAADAEPAADTRADAAGVLDAGSADGAHDGAGAGAGDAVAPEPPKRAAGSAPAHEPKKDAEIGEGSLFDI